MMITGFIVRCGACGHNNRPNKSPRLGIRMVLAGEFDECRKCGTGFVSISVPNRPIVREIMKQVEVISPVVQIFDYTGGVPQAIGYA